MPSLRLWPVSDAIAGASKVRIQIEHTVAGVLSLSLLCGVSVGAAAADPPSPKRPTLTVFAAASTTDALTALFSQYEKRTGTTIHPAFGTSSTLARQITAGARADIFISASTDWMDYLQERDLLSPGNRRDLLGNRLVLIEPASAHGERAGTVDLLHVLPEIVGRIAMGDPTHVPAGVYAKSALERLGVYDALKTRLVECGTVREALGLVESRQVAAGIVYRSDAWASRQIRVLGVFPESFHERIVYPIAVLRAGHPAADDLVRFLTSGEAAVILASYGFEAGDGTIVQPPPTRLGEARFLVPGGFRRWLPTAHERATVFISLKVAAGCVAVLALPGVLLAFLLARKDFLGKTLVEMLVHAPLVIPPVVTGYVLLILLGNNGLLGRWLYHAFGIELAFTINGAVLAAAVMALPLMVRSARVAMELVDRRLEEAARTLGAGPGRTFLLVTVPLALPGIVSGLILAFARSLGEFGATAVFVGAMEGHAKTLPLAIYSHMQTASGEASVIRLVAISVLLSLAAVGFSEVSTRRARRAVRANHAT